MRCLLDLLPSQLETLEVWDCAVYSLESLYISVKTMKHQHSSLLPLRHVTITFEVITGRES